MTIVFGVSSIYADNQQGNTHNSNTQVEVKNDKNKPKPTPKPQPSENQTNSMSSVKQPPKATLPQTGQTLHWGVTAVGIITLFLVFTIISMDRFNRKLAKEDHHELQTK